MTVPVAVTYFTTMSELFGILSINLWTGSGSGKGTTSPKNTGGLLGSKPKTRRNLHVKSCHTSAYLHIMIYSDPKPQFSRVTTFSQIKIYNIWECLHINMTDHSSALIEETPIDSYF